MRQGLLYLLELLMLCLLIKSAVSNEKNLSLTEEKQNAMRVRAMSQSCGIKKEKVTVKEKGCQEKRKNIYISIYLFHYIYLITFYS